jgi:hypothetical protein
MNGDSWVNGAKAGRACSAKNNEIHANAKKIADEFFREPWH